MADRTATTHWSGGLTTGSGTIQLVSSGAAAFDYSLATRAGEPQGRTSPEELLAASHSACYSMQLSALLTSQGAPPEEIETTATVSQRQRGEAFPITDIALRVRAVVPGIDSGAFQRAAEKAKEICPVSEALAGPAISLVEATLEQAAPSDAGP